MTRDVIDIQAQIRALSRDEKAVLLRSLIAELDGVPEQDIEQAWLAEAQRRHAEASSGRVQSVPSERVFQKAYENLNRQKTR